MAENYKTSDHQSVIPYLVVGDLEQELEFVKEVFDAQELFVARDPEGCIGHARVKIGDSVLMMHQAHEKFPALPAPVYVYLPDVDAVYQRALEAGATGLGKPEDQFYGDRTGAIRDPGGIHWWIATLMENLSADELLRRQAAAFVYA